MKYNMKWYEILSFIGVAVICILITFVYLGYLGTNEIAYAPPKISYIEFDCAGNYDKMRDIYFTEWNPAANINSQENYP